MLLFKKKTLVVHVGDMHVGSTAALCPPQVSLDSGGTYVASPVQQFYWECWQRFWEDTLAYKKKHRAECVVILGGDLGEGDHHNTTQIWFEEKADQERAIQQTLSVAEPVADQWVFVRGTIAHESDPEHRAAFLAKKWDVLKNGDLFSYWVYTDVHGGVRFEVAHAPGTKSWVPHTSGATCARHAQYTKTEYDDSNIEPPQIVVRHHVHYWEGPGCHRGVCCFFVPGWQAPTSWVRGRGVKSAAPAGFVPGGLRILCEDGHWQYDWKLFRPPSGVAWDK